MSGFVKTYGDAPQAREALRRTQTLRAQGVPTPACVAGPAADALQFARIDGYSGRALLGRNPAPLFRALAQLHAARVPDLPVYDPLLRIRFRLGLTTRHEFHALTQGPVPGGNKTVHGDLHVGQFLQARCGQVWIVDLDDLALGPAEADLANFTAHLATTVPVLSIQQRANQICTIWEAQGHRTKGAVFNRYLKLALLRRHLKLRAAGRPDFEMMILSYLRASDSLSIR